MAGMKQNMAPLWKKLMKNVDLDEPTSFLDHVNLGCTQRECKPNDNIFLRTEKCPNHEFPLEHLKNYQDGKIVHAKTVAWSCDVEGHARTCVERCCELGNKKTEQL